MATRFDELVQGARYPIPPTSHTARRGAYRNIAAELARICAHARPSEWPLGRSTNDAATLKRIKAGIRVMTGRDAGPIYFVGVTGRYLFHDDWIVSQGQEQGLHEALRASLREASGDTMRNRLEGPLASAWPERTPREGLRIECDRLGVNIPNAALLGHLSTVVARSVFYPLAFLAGGQVERANTFFPLLDLLPDYIPIGERTGEPTGSYLVACNDR